MVASCTADSRRRQRKPCRQYTLRSPRQHIIIFDGEIVQDITSRRRHDHRWPKKRRDRGARYHRMPRRAMRRRDVITSLLHGRSAPAGSIATPSIAADARDAVDAAAAAEAVPAYRHGLRAQRRRRSISSGAKAPPLRHISSGISRGHRSPALMLKDGMAGEASRGAATKSRRYYRRSCARARWPCAR